MTTHIYTRVSTLGQAGEGKTSLEDQENRCRGAAMVLGDADPVIWSDPGVSGSVPLIERDDGGAMYAALKPGDTVIAAKLDRLFRSASDALSTSETLQLIGVKLILLDIGIDPVTDGMSKLFFSILAAVSEFEKGRILERMRDGRRGKQRRSGYLGGDPPYGYRVEGIGETAHLVLVPEEQVVIRKARDLRRQGKSLRDIAEILGEAGHLTRRGTYWEAIQVKRMIERAPEGRLAV